MLEEKMGWQGTIRVIVRSAKTGRFIGGKVINNTITNGGKDALVNALGGSAAQISYVEVGSDDGTILPLSATNTALGNAQFRKAVTSSSNIGTGQRKTTLYLTPSECNSFTIKEIGWFIGGSATLGSGTLLARVLYTHSKVSTESLQLDRTDTLS